MTVLSTIACPLSRGARAAFCCGALLTAAFVTLSLLDLYLTWYLLKTQGSHCYEANPIAADVLHKWGWWGLGSYKLACSGVVLAVGAFVSRSRPRLGRRLLVLSSLIVAVVVGHSVILLVRIEAAEQALARAQEKSRRLTQEFHEQQDYAVWLERLAYDVAKERLSLKAATKMLAARITQLRYFNPSRRFRELYQDLDSSACLAAHVVRQVGLVSRDGPLDDKPLTRLEEEFVRWHRCPLPAFAREPYLPELEQEAPVATPTIHHS